MKIFQNHLSKIKHVNLNQIKNNNNKDFLRAKIRLKLKEQLIIQQYQIFNLVSVLKVTVLKDIVNVFRMEESALMNVNALIARILHNFQMRGTLQIIENPRAIKIFLYKLIMAANVDRVDVLKNIVNVLKKDKSVQKCVLVKIVKIFHLSEIVKKN